MAQCAQFPPQDETPLFLSFRSLTIMPATSSASASAISIVPRLAASQFITARSSFPAGLVYSRAGARFREAPPENRKRKPGTMPDPSGDYSFFVSLVASLYFRKNSMYTMPAMSASEQIKPITLKLPVKRPPIWLMHSATA